MNYEARFGGIGRLYGRSGLDILRNSRMAVVGIGGVGSWAAEALARSGVGAIILMDLDDLCITNTNRQIHALETTIGQSKTEAMAAPGKSTRRRKSSPSTVSTRPPMRKNCWRRNRTLSLTPLTP